MRPVTVVGAREYLGLTADDMSQDSLIGRLLDSAEAEVSTYLGRSVRSASLVDQFSQWGDLQASHPINTDQTVTLTYYDTDEASQTVDAGDYHIEQIRKADVLVYHPDDFPELGEQYRQPIRLSYTSKAIAAEKDRMFGDVTS
ncbi:MAG: phage head-tail connector protein, partial [Gammaproteobacteria bacterium]|nr:phage head-tail connector protein [Gammaproteobacteria bacterium]